VILRINAVGFVSWNQEYRKILISSFRFANVKALANMFMLLVSKHGSTAKFKNRRANA